MRRIYRRLGGDNGVGMTEAAWPEQKVGVRNMLRRPASTHIKDGLHEELPRRERRVGALLTERLNALKSRENVGKKRLQKQIIRPVRRIGEFREHGFERSKL